MKKRYFYFGLFGLALFEILNVYFIMPMPGSQHSNSIHIAYFLYSWRWLFRILFFAMIVAGFLNAFRIKHKWIPALLFIFAFGITYLFNFKMVADRMFLQAKTVDLKSLNENRLPTDRMIIGVEHNGEAKAYPIEFLAYHHQVRDEIGGKPIMVTYCSVCRTGRVFEPVVNGKTENFRLVGMDHFNAMFEDEKTGSWWRQVTGEAVTGELKGSFLPEVQSYQMTIDKWILLHPDGRIMQADESSSMNYDSLARFEQGKSRSSLTGTDTSSWKDKSWVVGIMIGNASKAYDWNDLKKVRLINDTIGIHSIVVALSDDEKSFVAFEKPMGETFTMRNDTLLSSSTCYDFSGSDLHDPEQRLKPLHAYQEFWHSWRTFHPQTGKY